MVFKKQQSKPLSDQQVINIRNMYFNELKSYEQIMAHLSSIEQIFVSKSLLQKAIHAKSPYNLIEDGIQPHIKAKRKPKRETYPLYLKSRSNQYYKSKRKPTESLFAPSLDSMQEYINSLQQWETVTIPYQDAQELFKELDKRSLPYTYTSDFPNLKIQLK